jgi:hypothetical protein
MEGSVRHGHTRGPRGSNMRSPTYNTWRSMVSRCTCKTDTAFPSYGGKGISVCDRWRNFDAFLSDMGERPEGASLDRVDNAKGYEPSNCRWADRRLQTRNRGVTRLIYVRGEGRTVREWAETLNSPVKTVSNRLYRRGEAEVSRWINERLPING